jgi:hypothetical protein
MILFPGGCEPGAPLGHAPCDHPYRLIKKRSRRSSAYLLVANRVRNRTSSSSSLSLLSPQYFTDDPCASLRLNAVDLVSRGRYLAPPPDPAPPTSDLTPSATSTDLAPPVAQWRATGRGP